MALDNGCLYGKINCMKKIFISCAAALLSSLSLYSDDFKFGINKDVEIPSVSYSVDSSISNVDRNTIRGVKNLCLFSNEDDISSGLISAIKSANKTLEIAIYSLSNKAISDAILDVFKRGVSVRVVIDWGQVSTSKIDPSVKALMDAKVPMKSLKGGGNYGIMHNKITIVDRSLLITGSYNYTVSANTKNFENIVFITDKNNINSYVQYFENMWSAGTDVYSTSKSGYRLPAGVEQALLSRINSIRGNILKLINSSSRTIDIAVYSISDSEIYNALTAARNRGVSIRIVTDRLQSSQSETVKSLANAGFDIKISDGYNKGMMHNKYAIFDGATMVTGSFNWSNNAENYNWENDIVLTSPYVAYFHRNFETIYNQSKPFTPSSPTDDEKPVSR